MLALWWWGEALLPFLHQRGHGSLEIGRREGFKSWPLDVLNPFGWSAVFVVGGIYDSGPSQS
jgi:hypothetical protein